MIGVTTAWLAPTYDFWSTPWKRTDSKEISALERRCTYRGGSQKQFVHEPVWLLLGLDGTRAEGFPLLGRETMSQYKNVSKSYVQTMQNDIREAVYFIAFTILHKGKEGRA